MASTENGTFCRTVGRGGSMGAGITALRSAVTEGTSGQMTEPATRVRLQVTQRLRDSLCLLTGAGFTVRARTGCSVGDLLCAQLGIEPDYLAGRIQIIFLNGKPVNDVDTAIVTADATIGLSAAMPGLAGAMLRKGSRYAPMRIQLPDEARDQARATVGESDVIIKLFNMLQTEIGPEFLRRGVRITGRAFGDLIARLASTVRADIITAEVDGQSVDPQALLDTDWSGHQLLLAVRL